MILSSLQSIRMFEIAQSNSRFAFNWPNRFSRTAVVAIARPNPANCPSQAPEEIFASDAVDKLNANAAIAVYDTMLATEINL